MAITMDIHMTKAFQMGMHIHMVMGIHMVMAIHMNMEMIMTTAMVLVIWASLLTIKPPRRSPNITNQLLRTMSCLFRPSSGLPPPTPTSTVSQVQLQSLHLPMRRRTK